MDNIETARDCCAGTNSGMAYRVKSNGSSCHICQGILILIILLLIIVICL